MPLAFQQVYQLTQGDFRMIALGCRTREQYDENDVWRPCTQFLVNSEPHGGHQFFGEVIEDDVSTGVVVMRDVVNDGLIWRFEPLTLEHFREMGEEGSIGGYDKLKDVLLTDDAVRDYYRTQYLDEDWWAETE